MLPASRAASAGASVRQPVWHRLWKALLLALVMLLPVPFGAVAAADTGLQSPEAGVQNSAGLLQVSLEPDRSSGASDALPVEPGTPLYVFVDSEGIDQVAFSVTDDSGNTSHVRTEYYRPYDLIGAVPGGVDALGWTPDEGEYVVTASVSYRDGSREQYQLSVSVGEAGSSVSVIESGEGGNEGQEGSYESKPAPESNRSLDASYMEAWETGDHEVLRSWFEENVRGPLDPSATAGGGTITEQDQADALAGKVVTGDLTVDAASSHEPIVLRDIHLQASVLTIVSGHVVIENASIDGQNQPTNRCGYLNIKDATVDIDRLAIRGAGDAIRLTGSPDVSAEYLYISDPATAQSCNGHHDGIQFMGGDAVFTATFVDYTGPGGSQGVLVKADSQDIGVFAYEYSFLTGGGNALTFEPTSKGFPDDVQLDNVLVADGCRNNVVSLYDPHSMNPPMELITRWDLTASKSGEQFPAQNGKKCDSLPE